MIGDMVSVKSLIAVPSLLRVRVLMLGAIRRTEWIPS